VVEVEVEAERQPCVPNLVDDDARLCDLGRYQIALG
jgi:hypothetical protein